MGKQIIELAASRFMSYWKRSSGRGGSVARVAVMFAAVVVVLASQPSVAQGDGTSGRAPGMLPGPSPRNVAIGGFSPSLFKFKTTQQDDPSLPAGGWQEADPTLKIVDGRQDPPTSWTCTYNFGIPLRTVVHGKVSASNAADIAAEVATLGSGIAMKRKSSWVPADFCNQFLTDMKAILAAPKGPYQGYGARVKR